jgi:hypothetical protein
MSMLKANSWWEKSQFKKNYWEQEAVLLAERWVSGRTTYIHAFSQSRHAAIITATETLQSVGGRLLLSFTATLRQQEFRLHRSPSAIEGVRSRLRSTEEAEGYLGLKSTPTEYITFFRTFAERVRHSTDVQAQYRLNTSTHFRPQVRSFPAMGVWDLFPCSEGPCAEGFLVHCY